MRLSDTIESFIKQMLGASEENGVELKRNELAEYFGCAPSQINYVLATRFTPDHGYVVESHRGGGGCIRIVHVERDQGDFLDYLIRERVGASLEDKDARVEKEKGELTTEDARASLAASAIEMFEAFVSHRDDRSEDGTRRFSKAERRLIDEALKSGKQTTSSGFSLLHKGLLLFWL